MQTTVFIIHFSHSYADNIHYIDTAITVQGKFGFRLIMFVSVCKFTNLEIFVKLYHQTAATSQRIVRHR
jgi:hypothetical protein